VALSAIALFAVLVIQELVGPAGFSAAPAQGPMLVPLLLTIALIILAWRRSTDSSDLLAALDASQRREERLAYFDELTGLHNRRYLAAEFSRRAAEEHVTLLLLDLDGFKGVNDLHGHEAGDAVLTTIANRIIASVPDDGLVVRLGGDEFAVCLLGKYGAANVNQLADTLLVEAGKPIGIRNGHVQVGVSIGIGSCGRGAGNLSDLLRRSDIAMYEAKRQGKNCSVWFAPAMERARTARSQAESEIRRGIACGEFIPHFQPLLDLPDMSIRGFEALARWHHPTRGLLQSEEFMPVAASSGLIAELSSSVMRAAVNEALRWPEQLVLSVNLAPSELRDPALADRIGGIISGAGFSHTRLEVEVCEQSLLHDNEMALENLEKLRSRGVSVSLEDFGTGYAALARFRELPFDRIKIDRAFVNTLSRDRHSAAIVAAITALGKSLSLPITAEGVEEVRVQELLIELGATEGQGRLYGDAISGEQAALLLSALKGTGLLNGVSQPPQKNGARAA
jgi:diguanylate cyclase (GGDEF)-like protein